MKIKKANIIYGLILLGHFVVSNYIPKDDIVVTYIVTILLPIILLLGIALFTRKSEFATWTMLFALILISYTMSAGAIAAFTHAVDKNPVISTDWLIQIINTILFIVGSFWIKHSKGISLNISAALLIFVAGIFGLIATAIEWFYGTNLIPGGIMGATVIFGIVLLFQILAQVACNKWDTE